MKKVSYLLYCICWMISTAAWANSANLVKNGDFEIKHSGWEARGKDAAKAMVWSTNEAHSGTKSLQLSMANATDNIIRWKSDLFDCEGKIKVSFWLKTEHLAPAQKGWLIVRIMLFDKDKKQCKIGKYPGVTIAYFGKRKSPKDGWQAYSKEIDLPDNVCYAYIDFFSNRCSGVATLDDVKVIQLTPSKIKIKTEERKMSNTKIDKPQSALERAEAAELARLQATKKSKKKHQTNSFLYGLKKGTELIIEDVTIDGEINQKNRTAAAQRMPDITIDGPNLKQDGKDIFLAWWWLGADSWHDKMLGFDCFAFHVNNRNTIIKAKKEAGKIKVYVDKKNAADVTQMERLVDQGLLPFIHFYENKHSNVLKRLAPDRLIKSHYWLYCDEDPEMNRLRRNSWKAVMRITRDYPSFVYNLNNETYYMDYCIWNIHDFRKRMKLKYNSIDKANSIWQTDYKSFAEVIPPYSSSEIMHTMASMENFNSHMLWLDWIKFTEEKFAETIAEQRDYVKNIDPAAKVTLKSPSGFMLRAEKGIYPPSLAAVEDIYCTEISTRFLNQYVGEEDEQEIKSMLKSVLSWDIVRNASKDRPIIADESSPFPVDKVVESHYLVPAKALAEWKFKSAAKDRSVNRRVRDIGTTEGWWRKDYDDSKWAIIKTPGIWGESGYPATTIGWYRTAIMIPKAERVFLNGMKLSDYSDIYINGELVKKTNGWKEQFNAEITDYVTFDKPTIIAIRIVNTYEQGGYIWGGIRGYINITKKSGREKLTAGQMRSHYWTSLVHGCSGLGMFKYPKNRKEYAIDALRILPYMKKEMESVGDIVLPRPRIKGQVGMLYPYDSLRYFLPKNWAAVTHNPLANSFVNYYAGLLFSGIATDLVRADETLDVWQGYPLIVIREAGRLTPASLDLVKAYVNAGGIIVVDNSSLKIDDNSNKKLKTADFLGATIGTALDKTSQFLLVNRPDISSATIQSLINKNFGVELEPLKDSKAIAKYGNGATAMTLKSFGKGKIYYLGAELGINGFNRLITAICAENSIAPPITLSPKVAGSLNYVERYLFKNDGKYLLYLNNWGAEAVASIMLPQLGAENYSVREVLSGKTIYQGKLAENAMQLTVNSQSPHVLLIEKSQDRPLKLAKLPPEYDAFMQRIWHDSPKHDDKVLFCVRGKHLQDKRSSPQILMPTLPLLLNQDNMEVNIALGNLADSVQACDYRDRSHDVDLENYKVLFIPSPIDMDENFTGKELAAIRKFVADGGGLFVCGLNSYGIHTVNRVATRVLKPFGISIVNSSLKDHQHHILGDPRFITFSDLKSKHPILKNVGTFQSMGSSYVKYKNPQSKPVSLISTKLKGREVPVLMAMEYGKGRIVVMGESNWMWPEWLQKGDNAQLAVNIFDWLARKPITKLNKKKITEVIKTPF